MRVSLSWITRLLGREALDIAPAELQARLSTRVAEIENEIETSGPRLDGIVVGKVLTCVQHPNADKLRCTTVDLGNNRIVPIVCGAPNVAAGQTVAVATVGTKLSADGKEFTIKAAKLRGEPSEGMICAEDEIGLGAGHDGIMVLNAALVAGTPLQQALKIGDAVFVIENHALTNRPDLWGQLGWAREIAATLDLPTPRTPSTAWTITPGAWSATIADDGCTTYCGALVDGVRNDESPAWLRAALEACKIRPLGLLVDVTNYVMLELGAPMHAFDRRSLDGSAITVRSAVAGEAFSTLDGKAHQLSVGDLLICDASKPVALAGIMGGVNSLVRADTTSIVLEAAIFKAERIRRTRIRTGIATDSSLRFEKGQPLEIAAAALNRAIELLQELCPGCRVSERFAAGRLTAEPRPITLDPTRVKRLTGLEVPVERQRQLLSGLGFELKGDQTQAPWWRAKDIHGPADLVEEIARHYGYQHLVPEVPRLPAAAPVINLLRQAEHRARVVLSAHGWDEVSCYAFSSEAWASALAWDAATLIRIAHPMSSEQTLLRQSLLPGLAEAVIRNRKHLPAVAVYEVGKRYGTGVGVGETIDETVTVAGACAAAGDEAPAFAARDAALALLRGLGFTPNFAVRSTPHAELQAGRALDLYVGKQHVGVAGEIPASVRALTGSNERIGWFSLSLEPLISVQGHLKPIAHVPPSRFQLVEREFTWICPEALPYGDLVSASRNAAGDLCQGIELITIYRGKPYAESEKAVSLRVALQAQDRTLEEKDLVHVTSRIITAVEKRTGAKQRSDG
jgi:phenylalanyl-tRNA synthetase beta chain